jgi:putative ABC transport system permease protein
MFRLALKSVWARKVKLGLLVGIIMASVGFIVGTFTFTNTINSGFKNLFGTVYKDTAAVVRGQKLSNDPDDSNFGARNMVTQDAVNKARTAPGVASADGIVEVQLTILDKQNKALTNSSGSYARKWFESSANANKLAEGVKPTKDGEAVINRLVAKRADLKIGDSVKIALGDQPELLEVVGIATFGTTDGTDLDVFVDEATAFRLAGRADGYDQIWIAGKPGTSQDQVRDAVAKAIGEPTRNDVITGAKITAEISKEISSSISGFAKFLLGFGLIALLVGIFVISNTFSILIAQRQRELALLRAVGASRRQILRSVLAESVVVGVIGSALGLGFGMLAAKGLQGLFNSAGAETPNTPLVITPGTLTLGLVVGLLATVASALFPAMRASSTPPIAAIRGAALDTSGGSRVRSLIGALVVAAGGALLAVGLTTSKNGIVYTALSFLAIVVGVSVLGPVLVKPIMSVLGAPLPKLRGMTGTLARQNAIRNPRRTSASSLALTIGVSVVAFFIVVGSSLKTSINSSIDKQFTADYIVQDNGGTGIATDVAKRLSTVKNISTASGLRGAQLTIDAKSKESVAVDPSTIGSLFDFGKVDGKLSDLNGDSIAVLSEVATQRGWKLGTVLNAQLSGKPAPLKIVALYEKKDTLGNYVLGTPTVMKYDPLDTKDFTVVMKLAKGADAAAATAAKTDLTNVLKDYPTLKLQDRAEFKAAQSGQVNQILALVSALLVLAIIIALIGIAITLSLSIFERVRELGVLRAIGQQRKQTSSTVRWESVLISVLGTVLGLMIGTGFGVAVVRAARSSGINHISVAPGQLVAVALLGALAGVAASVFPAYKASKTDIMSALAA